eukprot:GCRY01003845.1.p1 GENE.GCRY01003845.1~~GCRY01003845.1.p1  ORF type:complete len:309 (-),score=45.14 GCRY01003845.1:401-1246(-)
MVSSEGERWKFDISKWEPTPEEWEHCLSLIQSEEQQRVRKFRFEKDAKCALIGRLMIRSLIAQKLNLKNDEIVLKRTTAGKPYLFGNNDFQFNVSHHGTFVILGYEPNTKGIGADVMTLTVPKNYKDPRDFLKVFQKEYTKEEWSYIYEKPTFESSLPISEQFALCEKQMVERFFWVWVMKEVYVKCSGVGIGFGLSRISVKALDSGKTGVEPPQLSMAVDGESYDQKWRFETAFLDEDHTHVACVGFESDNAASSRTRESTKVDFKAVSIQELTSPLACE